MSTDTAPVHGLPPGDTPIRHQGLLFDSLPETEPRPSRRRAGKSRIVAATVVVDTVCEPAPLPPPPLFAAAAAQPDPFDPARLSLAEVRALVQALPDAKLAQLLGEAARELKQRVAAPGDDWDDGGEAPEPNPLLLRAARQAVGELSGDDG